MLARHVALPILVLAVFASVHWWPRSQSQSPSQISAAPSPIDEDMPRATERYDVGDPPRSIEELRERIAVVLRRERVAGGGFAIVDRNGPIWVGGIGVRNRDTRAPVEGDTAFRVGSLSKSVIALGVMRLVDQGKLDVDRPLREILPDFHIDNPWEATAPVTLAQCLEHTAGFDDVRFNDIFATDEGMTVRETLSLNPKSRTIRWKPGTRHAYSNYGYTVAALAIEEAAGEPFDDYLRREILAPMGITDADFRRTPSLEPRLATGYMDFTQPVVFRPFAHRPAGGLLASAEDLAKLVHFWIVRGEGYPSIVSRASLDRIEHSGTLPYPHVDAEYGFANYSDVMHPAIGRGHDGGMPGFHSSYRYFPSLGVGYVMLLNGSYMFRGYFEIRELIFSYLTQGRAFSQPTVTESPELPGARYFAAGANNGPFAFVNSLFNGWRVTPIGDGKLLVRDLQGNSFPLFPATDGGYRIGPEFGSSVRFTTSSDGKPLMLLGWGYTEAASEWAARGRLAAFELATTLLVFAPGWAALELLFIPLFRRRILPYSLVLWPATAGLCCYALPRLIDHAFFTGVIGTMNPTTVGLCAVTILLAIASAMTLFCSVRWLVRPDRPRLIAMMVPLLCGIAFSGFSLFFAANGLIGLRTWSW